MQFLGRRKELGVLEQAYSEGRAFVVMYGRRRVGKTRLIKQFIQNKHALYFLASKESAPLNRQRFARAVGDFVGMPAIGQGRYDDWRPLFQIIAEHARNTASVLIIDELPYLVETDPSFTSVLQYAWDEQLEDAGVMLILCGSHMHMMEQSTLVEGSPLYGRSTAQVKLKPFMFDEFSEGFEDRTFEDQMRTYAVTGGVPKYFELFERGTFDDNVKRHALSTSGFLYNEPRFLLAQDTRIPVTHYSILRAMAYGNHKPSEIAGMLERPQTEISPYLKTLERLGYIERRVPVTELAPDKSKNGLYFIADGLLNFWFTYVLPFEGELEMDNVRPSLMAMANTFDTRFVPTAFESVSRQTLARLCAGGEIALEPNRIGAYWNKSATVEIDVCATFADSGSVLLGECKYHESKPFTTREFEELVAKGRSNGLASLDVAGYCLFSKTGFDKELLAAAADRKDLYLIDKTRLLSLP